MIWNSETLSNALRVAIPYSIICNEVQFNSKDVIKGDLFIALQGNSNGHDYVQDAINKGANAVIVSKQVDIPDKNKIIIVDNCFKALQKMAEYKRNYSKAKFIAITGSVGKTSTTEALKAILSKSSNVFASRGNFNNKLGMLINLASMPDDIEFAVFELGMNNKGEIRELVQILKPNISMITNISEAHLEFFNSLEDIARAKCEIFESFSENDVAVINADTNCYDKILSILEKLPITNIHSFGTASFRKLDTSEFSDIHLCSRTIVRSTGSIVNSFCLKLSEFSCISSNSNAALILYEILDDQVHLKYNINNKIIDVNLPVILKHFVENYAGVLLIISLLNKDLNNAADYLADITPTKGRREIMNIANSRIICDYYNASPQSMKAALKHLKRLPAENKTAIIGEMLELGQNSEKLHKELIPYILDAGCSKVFLVGTNTKYIYDLLSLEIVKKYFENVDELILHTKDLFKYNELILIKGSKGIKLDKIIDYYSKLD